MLSLWPDAICHVHFRITAEINVGLHPLLIAYVGDQSGGGVVAFVVRNGRNIASDCLEHIL